MITRAGRARQTRAAIYPVRGEFAMRDAKGAPPGRRLRAACGPNNLRLQFPGRRDLPMNGNLALPETTMWRAQVWPCGGVKDMRLSES